MNEIAKRPRGRPKGSRNKVSKEARELLAQGGDGAVKTLLAIASGRAVYAPAAEGKRERIIPTLDQRIAAARIIVNKLVPDMKASEAATVEWISDKEFKLTWTIRARQATPPAPSGVSIPLYRD